jgi:hypothetical protein
MANQRQIADGAVNMVQGTRADAAAELAFVRAVFAKLAEGSRVRDQYAQLAAGIASKLDELDEELAALCSVRDELASAAAIVISNGGAVT